MFSRIIKSSLTKKETFMYIAFMLIACIGSILICVYSSKYGVGLSYDSIVYLSTSNSLVNGKGFMAFGNSPLVLQPPLYPILLACISRLLNVRVLTAALIIQSGIYGLIIFLTGYLSIKVLKQTPLFSFFAILSIFASKALVDSATMAWSEPLFIVFVLLSLIFAYQYRSSGEQKYIYLFSITTSLAILTRYVGVVLILVGFILVITNNFSTIKNKLNQIFILLLISLLPISIWLTRNYFLSHTLMGPRSPSVYTLTQNLNFTLNTILNWYVPKVVIQIGEITYFVVFCLGFILGFSIDHQGKNVIKFIRNIDPIVQYLILYLACIIFSSTTTSYDQISDRLLVPAFIPLTLYLLNNFERLFKALNKYKFHHIYQVILTIPILMCFFITSKAIFNEVNVWKNSGISGVNTKSWREDSLVDYIRHNHLPENCVVYSNGPEAVYFYGNEYAKLMPSKTIRDSNIVIADTSNLLQTWQPGEEICIVWFNKIKRTYLFSIDDLNAVTEVQTIISLDDGGIYIIPKDH